MYGLFKENMLSLLKKKNFLNNEKTLIFIFLIFFKLDLKLYDLRSLFNKLSVIDLSSRLIA